MILSDWYTTEDGYKLYLRFSQIHRHLTCGAFRLAHPEYIILKIKRK